MAGAPSKPSQGTPVKPQGFRTPQSSPLKQPLVTTQGSAPTHPLPRDEKSRARAIGRAERVRALLENPEYELWQLRMPSASELREKLPNLEFSINSDGKVVGSLMRGYQLGDLPLINARIAYPAGDGKLKMARPFNRVVGVMFRSSTELSEAPPPPAMEPLKVTVPRAPRFPGNNYKPPCRQEVLDARAEIEAKYLAKLPEFERVIDISGLQQDNSENAKNEEDVIVPPKSSASFGDPPIPVDPLSPEDLESISDDEMRNVQPDIKVDHVVGVRDEVSEEVNEPMPESSTPKKNNEGEKSTQQPEPISESSSMKKNGQMEESTGEEPEPVPEVSTMKEKNEQAERSSEKQPQSTTENTENQSLSDEKAGKLVEASEDTISEVKKAQLSHTENNEQVEKQKEHEVLLETSAKKKKKKKDKKKRRSIVNEEEEVEKKKEEALVEEVVRKKKKKRRSQTNDTEEGKEEVKQENVEGESARKKKKKKKRRSIANGDNAEEQEKVEDMDVETPTTVKKKKKKKAQLEGEAEVETSKSSGKKKSKKKRNEAKVEDEVATGENSAKKNSQEKQIEEGEDEANVVEQKENGVKRQKKKKRRRSENDLQAAGERTSKKRKKRESVPV